ncbi:hypothetical protein W97_03264 [Coniosporium apollinis CBS 100218]|uniref:Uncharacterized protein n=1 Tax=Coniosporium apollinis (strain CBS 100218) TaxID=1168221 RepID=R7YQD5_CONA1|nr:uncharacterized protein W97_03264 [Coniosporium apollinis CBS 100218]EON64034.1 hypothetical protein W97_03264 [Coniosporium apollinis CBS 100218]
MSRNNRGPRSGQMKDDADEERNIWNQIIGDGRKIDALIAKSNELCKRMVELKDELDAAIGRRHNIFVIGPGL